MDTKNLNKMIGNKLHELRSKRNLSLDKLSQLTGVSKPMLAQIERGESNPTVNTLWKIARGLGVSFSTFLEEDKPDITTIPYDEVEVLQEEGGLFLVKTLFPMEHGKNFEIFHVTIKPNCRYLSEPHPKGVVEYILVEHGTLHIEINHDLHVLPVDHAIRFSADYTHIYTNKTEENCVVTMILFYPPFH